MEGPGAPLSQEVLFGIFAFSSDLICLCENNRITSINAAGVGMLGADDAESLIGRDFTEFLTANFAEAIDGFIDLLLDEREPTPLRLTDLGGETRGVEIYVRPAPGLTANANIIVASDITKEVKLSEEVRRRDARYRKLVNQAYNLICSCEEGRVSFINKAGIGMLRHQDASGIIGKNISELFHPDYR